MNIKKTVSLYPVLLLLGVSCPVAQADDAPRFEHLSDLLSDRAVSITQGWGVLGIDTMVRSTLQVPKPVLHLGELGLDTKVVPSDEPAPKLRIKDKEYARGIGHHAKGDIVVDLSGQFETFEAEVGLQWMGGTSAGSVVFQVFVDGQKMFQSGVMRENDAAVPVRVSLEGADELRLSVNDAGDGITADCADWADARLTRDPEASRTRTQPAVDVARFARVLSWDPNAMEGTRALRTDEIPAEDIAPYKEVLPSPEGTYAVPTVNGRGCIGLQWDENRILRRVAVEFPGGAVPSPDSIQLQYWTGESEWQGKWQMSSAVPKRIGESLEWHIDCRELIGGTQKVRWIVSNSRPVVLKRISAFTRSRWKMSGIRIEPARPGAGQETRIEIYNGVFLNASQEPFFRCTWDGSKPLALKVQASVRQPYKADRTVLRFGMPGAAFGVAIEDLLSNDCVYVRHANVFVTRQPSPVTPDQYLARISAQRSMLEDVRQRPDQDFHHALAVIHNKAQDIRGWAPMMISLACDNRKFLVHRDGPIVFNAYDSPDDFPGESDGIHTVAANIGEWRFVPTFGSGRALQFDRHLDGGWLPVPVTTIRDKNVAYRQMTRIAPVGEAPAGKPAWRRERALGVVEYLVKNSGTEAADVRLSFRFQPQKDPQRPVQYQEGNDGTVVASGGRILAFIDHRKAAPLSCAIEPTSVVLSGKLAAGAERACTVYLPAWNVAPQDLASLTKDAPWAPRVESYWKDLLRPAMQIEIPDALLANIIRASQVNCMMAARNQKRSEFVVPWISSVHFAYPESEANSILRGMDMNGHAEFARRGLDFYLKQANAAGYITILVHNKVANIKCGYTVVGTGEVLWTLGEHYGRTRDREWLRKIAPEVVRICKWIAGQREKTKRIDSKGQKAPECGLMTPGVTADWNRFAYRFFNDAQYARGLELAGRALADLGEPEAPAILDEARKYREDIVRAYGVMQAKMPVVPLKNGTWVPADPSLLGCYGNVEDFLPGEDVNRTYVYSVELGAHHLAANEVLDPTSKETDWMIDYLEDVQFLRTDWVDDPAKADAFDWGGFAKMQPYYCRNADIYAMRDDVKPFIRSYFNTIPALVNLEDLTFWEDMLGGRSAAGAWNKTHETGWFLGQTRTLFVTERGDELWLAPFVTDRWLRDGQEVSVRNAPTRFGKLDYAIRSRVAEGRIEGVVRLPEKCTAKKVVLRLRHPDSKQMKSVTIQGKPHADFDPRKETITFGPDGETITVEARY